MKAISTAAAPAAIGPYCQAIAAGERGNARVGAVGELEACGYAVMSVAGGIMSALIGGMYAAGGLKEVTRLFERVDPRMMFSLSAVSLSMNHMVRGGKVMRELKKYKPDVSIEDSPIFYCALAGDVKNYRERAERRAPQRDEKEIDRMRGRDISLATLKAIDAPAMLSRLIVTLSMESKCRAGGSESPSSRYFVC